MPYSNYSVSDRKAAAQLRYQIRRFSRQMIECGTDDRDAERINFYLNIAISEAAGSVDFHDDGTRMED